MENMKKSFLRVNELAHAFNLPRNMAREIVMEQTRQALLRSLWAWSLFVLMLAAASWFAVSHLPSACYIMIGLSVAWLASGRVLARSSILSVAHHRAEHLSVTAS